MPAWRPHAGVGDAGVHSTSPGLGLLEHRLDLLGVADVGGEAEAALGQALLLCPGREGRETRARVEDETGSLVGEGPRGGRADPSGGTGDEDDLVLESEIHGSLLS